MVAPADLDPPGPAAVAWGVHALRLGLAPDRLVLPVDGSGSFTATVRNIGKTVLHLVVAVEGLPDGATYAPAPERLKLLPTEHADVTVTLTLPGDRPAPAGVHVLGVVCRSSHDSSVSRCEELQLTVEPAPALTLVFDRQLVRSRSGGRFVGTVTNTGNTPLVVGFRARDPEGVMRLRFDPPHLDLPAAGRGHVLLTASAPAVWTGQDRQHAIRVDAEAQGAAADATVTLSQRPRLSGGVLRAAGGATAVAVLAGAVIAGLTLASAQDGDDPEDQDDTVSTPTVTTPEPTPTETPSPAPTDTPPPTPTGTTSPTATPGDSPPAPSAPDIETFDGLAVGPLDDGTFDAFQVSTVAVDPCPDEGLLARTDGDDVWVTAATTEEACTATPLLVRFEEPAVAVVLEVTDRATTYHLRVEDDRGSTRPVTVPADNGFLAVPVAEGRTVSSVVLAYDDPTAAGPLGLTAVSWRDGD